MIVIILSSMLIWSIKSSADADATHVRIRVRGSNGDEMGGRPNVVQNPYLAEMDGADGQLSSDEGDGIIGKAATASNAFLNARFGTLGRGHSAREFHGLAGGMASQNSGQIPTKSNPLEIVEIWGNLDESDKHGFIFLAVLFALILMCIVCCCCCCKKKERNTVPASVPYPNNLPQNTFVDV